MTDPDLFEHLTLDEAKALLHRVQQWAEAVYPRNDSEPWSRDDAAETIADLLIILNP